jgi:hypothetical protein
MGIREWQCVLWSNLDAGALRETSEGKERMVVRLCPQASIVGGVEIVRGVMGESLDAWKVQWTDNTQTWRGRNDEWRWRLFPQSEEARSNRSSLHKEGRNHPGRLDHRTEVSKGKTRC